MAMCFANTLGYAPGYAGTETVASNRIDFRTGEVSACVGILDAQYDEAIIRYVFSIESKYLKARARHRCY